MVQPAEFGAVPGTVANIRWFLAKPGAKIFPGWHAFGSPVWEPHPDEWTKGPGVFSEVEAWSKNHVPCPDGQEFHGLAQWYETGIPPEVLADPTPHETTDCWPFGYKVALPGKGSFRFYVQTADTILPSKGWYFFIGYF